MSNDITRANSNALTSAGISPFKLYALSTTSQLSPYSPARFVKGDYLGGPRKSEVEIPRYSEAVFAVDRIQIGFVRLERGVKPEFRLSYLNDPTAHLYNRAELGDLDKSLWPIGLGGEPEDVWKFSNFMPMILTSNNEAYLFGTSTLGGRKACGALCNMFADQGHTQYPVGLLDWKFSDSTDFARNKDPSFPFVRWVDPAPYRELLDKKPSVNSAENNSDNQSSSPTFAPNARDRSRVAELIDDEIPF